MPNTHQIGEIFHICKHSHYYRTRVPIEYLSMVRENLENNICHDCSALNSKRLKEYMEFDADSLEQEYEYLVGMTSD